MDLKRLKGKLVGTAVSMDTIHKIAKVDLGSRGQTKDFSRRRYLSELYSKRNGLKREYT